MRGDFDADLAVCLLCREEAFEALFVYLAVLLVAVLPVEVLPACLRDAVLFAAVLLGLDAGLDAVSFDFDPEAAARLAGDFGCVFAEARLFVADLAEAVGVAGFACGFLHEADED